MRAALVAATFAGLATAWDSQVPLVTGYDSLDDASIQAMQFATYDLSEERLIHVLGEDQPRRVTEEEKLILLQNHRTFLDITEHPDFLTRPTPPKSFVAPQTQFFAKEKNQIVASIQDDLDNVIDNLKSDLTTFTSFWTRNGKSEWGRRSSDWLFDHISNLLHAHPSPKVTTSINRAPHSIPQSSIVVRLESAESIIPTADREILIIGAHQDSLNYKLPFFRAPGADDDGSGTVVNIQILRSLLEHSFIPPPNVVLEFHWYAGEELGNIGAVDISNSYRNQSKPVKAMLQMDGISVNVPGEEPLIAIFDTNSNKELREFAAGLVEKYNSISWTWTNCGIRCGSDHIPWNRTGYPSMFVFERPFAWRNPDPYHTVHDTIDQPGFNFTHGAEFVKFGLAWITELAVSDY